MYQTPLDLIKNTDSNVGPERSGYVGLEKGPKNLHFKDTPWDSDSCWHLRAME